MAGKYNVASEYRTNPLSSIFSSTTIQLHEKNGTTKVYDNIHNVNAFLNKAFRNKSILSATIVDLSDDSSKKVKNYNL